MINVIFNCSSLIKYIKIAIFFYFARNRETVINVKRSILKIQTMCSLLIYLATSVILLVLVNYQRNFNYSSGVILSNREFNVAVANSFLFGLTSLLFFINWNSVNQNTVLKDFEFQTLTEDTNNDIIENNDTSNDVIFSVSYK